jgi:hypothetical protein
MSFDKKAWQKNYKSNPKQKKSHKISEWRTKQKMKETNERFDYIYNRWLTSKNCELCDCEYVLKKNIKVCDHHHLSGHFRNVICNKCNCYIAKVDRIKERVNLELHRYFKFVE